MRKSFAKHSTHQSPEIVKGLLAISGEKSKTLGVSQASPFKIVTKQEKSKREDDEVCSTHNQGIVAFDENTGQTLCERCVYEGAGEQPVFMATVAKKINTAFQEEHSKFIGHCEELEEINQLQIRDKI